MLLLLANKDEYYNIIRRY